MAEERYEAVSCDYHDQLEAAAMHRNEVELEFELDGLPQKGARTGGGCLHEQWRGVHPLRLGCRVGGDPAGSHHFDEGVSGAAVREAVSAPVS